jgi:hypothetical protein
VPDRFASYADLDAWAGSFDVGQIIATPDQTTALLVGLCRTFADQLDVIQLRCLDAAMLPGSEPEVGVIADRKEISRRIGQETPGLVPGVRLSSIVHLPPDQARNRLVFAACVAERDPLDWYVAEFVALWAEDAAIPIAKCLSTFREHVPGFSG